MADVLLLTASSSCTAWLSHRVGLELSRKQQNSISLALGLSLSLFSLSILEALPPSWLLLLEHDGSTDEVLGTDGSLSISAVYRLLLWILCIWIVFVLPAVAGAQLLGTMLAAADTTDGSNKLHRGATRGWTLRCNRKFRWAGFVARALLTFPVVLIRLVYAICCRLSRQYVRRPQIQPPVLVMTTADEATSGRSGRTAAAVRGIASSWINQPRHIQNAILGSILGVTTSLAFLRGIGRLVMGSSLTSAPTSHDEDDEGATSILPTMVSWLCAVGLLLSSSLNGFGSVSMPHSCLAGFYLEPIRPEAIVKAQAELEQTRAALEATRADLLSMNTTSVARLSSALLDGMARRRQKSFGEESMHRKQALQRDMEFLDTLVRELEDDILDMRYSHSTASMARTSWGKLRSWLGVLFSVILLIRLCTAVVSMWSGLSSESAAMTKHRDPITTTLLWLTGHHIVHQQDYNTLSQSISLLLTAFLSASQVRMFLRTMSAIQRRLLRIYRSCCCPQAVSSTGPFLHGHHADSFAYLLSAVLGCYFLSCVVLTKLSLPLAYRSAFSTAMGNTTFVVQSSVANAVYAVSAIASAVVLGLLFGIQRQNTKRHASFDESLPLGSLDAC